MARRSSRRLIVALTVVAVLAAGLIIATGVPNLLRVPPASAAPTCAVGADTWNGTTDSWYNPSDWSTGAIPTSTTDACLPAGSYTVTIAGNGGIDAQVATLDILSAPSMVPTLIITHDPGNDAGHLTSSGDITNAGTIQIGDSGTNTESILSIGGTLTNTGTIDTQGCCNTDQSIGGSIDNEGTFTVNSGSEAELNNGGSTFTNTGSISIAATDNMTVTGGTFDLNGGTLTNDGTFLQVGGTFNHNGGTVSGNNPYLDGVALAPDPSSGSATFFVYGSNTLTSDVSSDDTVVITHDSDNNPGTLTVSSDLTNAGTIEVGDTGSNVPEFLTVSGGTLTNTGTLETEGEFGSTIQTISGNIDNQETFTFNSSAHLDPGQIDDYGTMTAADGITLTNVDDTLVVEPGGTFTVDPTGIYTQDSGATLGVTVISPDTTYTGISGGTTHLDGTLQVTTIGSPAGGSAWPIISGVSSTGTFATYEFGVWDYTEDYSTTGLTLVAPASTGTATATVTTTATPAALGGDASDSVKVTGGGATPTGTATFFYCYSATTITMCSSSATEIDPGSEPVALVDGDASSPASVPVDNAGYYCFFASYSGDSTYAGPTTTDTGSECFQVTGTATATVTTTDTPAGLGGDASDSVKVTGGGATPTGTATFFYCYSATTITTCSSSGTEIGSPVSLVDGDASSSSITVEDAGYYCFFASYSGDSTYAGPTTTDADSECFTVPTASGIATVTTRATPAGLGGDASDSVKVTGGGATPTGTATFFYCYSVTFITTCSSSRGTEIDPVSEPVTLVDGEADSPASVPVEDAGYYCFFASYSGDSNYAGPTTADTGLECFTVSGSTAPTSPPTTTPFPNQIYGTDAVGTSIAISEAEYPTAGSAKAVVLARDDFFSDALAGGPLAAAVDGPLLITEGAPISSTLDPRVQAEIERVLPKGGTVYILGGDQALSPNIDAALEALGYIVVREAGIDEYATAVDIANTIATTSWGTPSTIFEATGLYFYDALSAVPAAVEEHAAILLTHGSTQSPETAAYLAEHPGDTRYAVGGPLAALGADPTAIGVYGQDLFNTSAAVASYFFPHPSIFGVATAADFPDALGGGVFMVSGGRMGPILLVNPSTPLPPEILPYLAGLAVGTESYVFGGPLAVGASVLSALQAAVG
jgi:hypothetical protein